MRKINLKEGLNDVRVANLNLLIAIDRLSICDTAKRVNIPRQPLSSMISKKRLISDQYARRIEEGFGHIAGWLDFPQETDSVGLYSKDALVSAVTFVESNVTIKTYYEALLPEQKGDFIDRLYNIYIDPAVQKLPNNTILSLMGVKDAKKAKNENTNEY